MLTTYKHYRHSGLLHPLRRFAITTLLSLTVTACSLLEPLPSKEVTTYTLSTLPADIQCSSVKSNSLLVTIPLTSSVYQSSKMAYSTRPYALDYYVNNEWAAPPADMLFPLMINQLSATGCASTVVGEPFGSYTDLRLDSQLIRFERNFDGSSSHYIVDLRVVLVDATQNEIITSQRLQSTQPVNGSSLYASVVAANHAVNDIMVQLARFCTGHC